MKRRPLYSRSGRPRGSGGPPWVAPDGLSPVFADLPAEELGPTWRRRGADGWRKFYARHQGKVLVASSVLLTLLAVSFYNATRPPAQHLTQHDLDQAVNFSIDHRPPAPAITAVAYAKIIPSVVRVDGYDPESDLKLPPGHPPLELTPHDPSSQLDPGTPEPGTGPAPGGKGGAGIAPPQQAAPAIPAPSTGAQAPPAPGQPGADKQSEPYYNTAVGTGVVIKDDGTILTNLHVAAAASRLRVTFADGTQADAAIVGTEPENDLAIIKPDKVPDDLKPATLASTQGLHPGDQVEAVGFPFGIGPSASAGVVSGLKREFEEEGRGRLTNLIQFDAAANPGNSGGPLIDADGEVVGIVTGILNPTGQRTFAGIGFAVPIENAAGGMGESPL